MAVLHRHCEFVMDLQLRTQPHAFLLQAMKFEVLMFTGGFLELIQLPFLSMGFGLGVWTYLDWQVLGIQFKCRVHYLLVF